MTNTDPTIESLLEQRALYEQWLAKLDAAANKAPPTVRMKVRGDYEARLHGVIEQLRGHGATITEELERHQASQAALDGERRGAEEQLSEAEVRHAVGEYTEEEWQNMSRENQGRLDGLREQLRSVGNEIARLAEVQTLIGAPSRRSEPPPAPPPVAERPAPPPPHEPEPEPEQRYEPPPAPRPAPKPPAPPRAREPEPASPPGDELAFLKSVSDEDHMPASRRPSNPGASSPGHGSRAVEAAPPPIAPQSKTGAPGVAKTLKCGECGTLNRPTEWYCERCGAELAGV
ncbi:MAG: hypothetical protein ACR2HK_03165 [Gemmatimonadales bacterium]